MSFKDWWERYWPTMGHLVDNVEEDAAKAGWDAQQAEIDRLRAALEALVAAGPLEPDPCDGGANCHYCMETMVGTKIDHDDDCPYIAAKKALEADDE